mmetsp:Transcript_42565/g.51712  ORF Transcript_42565/g.51712 Transcript_42565/m.51712 type:complete len:175 (+) Transcript_42565:106-630(+)|eukprot:CAMPEP_0197846774 /NCGR_PEP_ID=MMETSP1438-20131217/4345_1 /TAXON_ID=1461541 /ORGANISM="Pterosperma sp., Strain CCMP1384" /LENGTH=174 /DNA_ID=CAMNT_0043458537 /DNA_START=106 /DNA_END=630 /DNA_ORIENTATION=+
MSKILSVLLLLFISASFIAGTTADDIVDPPTDLSNVDKLLMFAAGQGETTKVKEALEQGANVNCRNEFGETPLHVAGISGDLETLEALIAAGGNVNAKADEGTSLAMSPLHWMVYPDYREGVKALLAAGADVNIQNQEGQTPLDMCSGAKYKEMAAILKAAGGKKGIHLNRDEL